MTINTQKLLMTKMSAGIDQLAIQEHERYPAFKVIAGLPFNLSVCLHATDISVPDTVRRMSAMDYIVDACNAVPELCDTIDAQTAEIAQLKAAQIWQPIETAPIGKNPDGMIWLLLAWGPEGDQSTGSGFRWRDKWFVAAAFYRSGQDRSYELREVEVRPTHWMPLPAAPDASSGESHAPTV